MASDTEDFFSEYEYSKFGNEILNSYLNKAHKYDKVLADILEKVRFLASQGSNECTYCLQPGFPVEVLTGSLAKRKMRVSDYGNGRIHIEWSYKENK